MSMHQRVTDQERANRTAQMIIDELRDLKGGLAEVIHMQGEFHQVLDSVREEMKVLRQERTVRADKRCGGPSLDNGSGISDKQEAICREVVPKVIGDLQELSISIEHITAAQKLLWWPSIQELFSQTQTSYKENYVMELEETHGLLRVYERDEEADLGDGGQPGP